MGDVATVRSAVAAAIDALTGWRESRWAPELWGSDPDGYQHLVFAVAAVNTEPNDGRHHLTDGHLAFTTLDVRWAHRLRGDAQVTDYAAALDAEQAMVKAVVGIASQKVLLVRLARGALAEGYVVGTATFRAMHRYALT